MEGRFRKPDAVLGFAIAFSVWGALSLLWTISYANTVRLATTYAQLVASVWVIREFVRTREEMQPLLVAILLRLVRAPDGPSEQLQAQYWAPDRFAARFTGMRP